MNITIPDIPASLNPKGWKVEVSFPGELKEGEWPLVWFASTYNWGKAIIRNDLTMEMRARLIEPKYWFNGEMKTESECRELLERDYELVEDRPDVDNCADCPFDKYGCPWSEWPVGLACTGYRHWRKKQPKECSQCHGTGKVLGTPYDKPEQCDCRPVNLKRAPDNLPEGHVAYPVVMDDEKGMCIQIPMFDPRSVGICPNGLYINGLYLYGWCEDDARFFEPFPLGRVYQAKWALFRKVEVTK